MVMHARTGGNIEVMGLMQGKIHGDTMIVMDAFALPVEGTETRVNAQAEGYEYMVSYMTTIQQVGRLENVLGWYHSHPGYGCWLSGIDVDTQMLNQQYQEPFVAIVIDPKRTMSAGRVDIGAFRTYPKDYKPPMDGRDEYQSIPLSKIDDFGVHCNRYYPLEISYFKSTLDAKLLEQLWNKYWTHTLSQSPLIANYDYNTRMTGDLAEKLEQSIGQVDRRGRSFAGPVGFEFGDRPGLQRMRVKPKPTYESLNESMKPTSGPLTPIVHDCTRLTSETSHGMLTETLKNIIFNRTICCPSSSQTTTAQSS
ncbi:COP9 signalosome complex subunit 5-like protein [Syncephalis pseudoplumigaleata]|uniref:COP9 signalosome complex subunit 5 n=1 Tax=Syncephalis pseudoplumigaleata TaxID=1712513 RepID=A0A4P9YRF7_9FUNG|nr:COP9 signalosome complex subunit 5-like protein [Syncephalis pseudoplumigaleata]|eukprot:RKP22436.1 COP9 signalosome complex subunit 5-like protein [Syncephalis pseudoplumigaleata]